MPRDDKKMDVLSLNWPSLTIVAGMTQSGKTSLARWLILQGGREGSFKKIVVMCPTAGLSHDYAFIEKTAGELTTEPTVKKVEQLLHEQKSLAARRPVLLVLDDWVGVLQVRDSKLFDQLASSSRHYHISIMILTQDLMKLSPILRQNASTLFVTKVREHNLKAVFEMANDFPTFAQFRTFMLDNCKNYNAIRFDQNAYSHTTVFKLGLCPKFRLQ